METSLKGYTALVCGSTQGIGKAIAMTFAEAGATCILLARNEARLREVLAELPAADGQQHQFAVADFTKPEQVKQVVQELVGKESIQILVNNTGGPAPGPLADAASGQLLDAFTQHIINYQNLVQLVLPGMKAAGYGRIINIVSTTVKIPLPNLGVSNTIRAATAGWSKTLSLEVAKDGITVNNVLPGYTETQRLNSLIKANAEKQQIDIGELTEKMISQIPARRFGKPREVAAVVGFLASPAAGYVNGTSIPVDGGSTGAF